MKKVFKSTLFVPLFLYMATMMGCSTTSTSKMTHTDWCQKRYNEAEELYKAKKYGRSIEKLEGILSTCAGSGYMEQAQFLLAESHFNLEQWIEARGEYGSFIVNFPGSPFAETAEYRKAVSSFNMDYKIDRDESNTTTAMKDFERYLANHPSTPLRDSVNYYYNLLVDRVAEKEFQTGRLYLRMEKPQAAVIYFKEFLETYPNAKRRQETLFLISDAYTDLDQFESARQYLAIAKEESSDNADVQKRVKKAEEKIVKAEESYEKRLKKESEKKRLQKEEKNLAN
ncbi:outer membrane protein assembly factor BamD [Fibrobacter succinogenes]|uniref:outer membrane protein assembly factor BamD n=1 Tax=Fibrobacter succinogenes TaxID=833 RepID=UPI001569F7EB|nr:outer membrane protein assembly factor BamD [Fibrobacter succinogenes]